jgi:hypothetical protein
MQSGIRGGFGVLRNLIQRAGGAKQARQLMEAVRQTLPAAEMTGVRGISEPVRRAAVQAGLVDELTAFPSAVSRQGGNVGLMGTRNVPTSRQLGQAPVPEFGPGSRTPQPPAGSRPVNTLIPQSPQGPRQRGGALAQTAQDNIPSPAARTQFTEDLISQPVPMGPARAPMQGPSMTGNPVQGQLDLRFPAGSRSVAEFTTTRGAIRPEGTNIAGQPYRGAPVASERNLETIRASMAPRAADVAEEIVTRAPQGQQSLFIDNVPDIWSGGYRIRPELARQLPREVQERIGTVMMREAADLGPVAPRPAFGPDAGPSPVDPAVAAAFARNAASGAELVDLSALMSNPAFRAATGLAGVGLFGAGVAGMMSGNRTGETTAGGPPSLPLTQAPTAPIFTEADGSPLGAVDPAAVLPPARGNIDPSVAAPTVTTGNLQQASSMREQLAQSAPGAAAVLRAVEPMGPEKYRSIEEYAAARKAYAEAKPEIQQLMKYMEGQSPSIGGGLAMWASSNPVLAYRFQERQLANPAANQQSAEAVTTTTVTAPIGSEVSAAAVGNAASVADAALNPSQGAFDMVDVTSPQVQPHLQRVQEFIRQQAPRSAMYAGY